MEEERSSTIPRRLLSSRRKSSDTGNTKRKSSDMDSKQTGTTALHGPPTIPSSPDPSLHRDSTTNMRRVFVGILLNASTTRKLIATKAGSVWCCIPNRKILETRSESISNCRCPSLWAERSALRRKDRKAQGQKSSKYRRMTPQLKVRSQRSLRGKTVKTGPSILQKKLE